MRKKPQVKRFLLTIQRGDALNGRRLRQRLSDCPGKLAFPSKKFDLFSRLSFERILIDAKFLSGVNRMRFTRFDSNARRGSTSSCIASVVFTLLALLSFAANAQTRPAFTAIGTSSIMLTLSSANGWGTYGEGHLAANSLGDLFFVDQQYSKGYYIPHGTTTPVLLISSLSGGRNVYVDASDNAYFPSTYSGYVVKIPYSSGGYTTGTALSSVTANCTATATTPCRAFAPSSMTSSSFISGYYQPTDLGIDGSGNVYVLESSDSTGTTGNKIVKLVPVSTSGTLTYSGSFLVTFTTAAVSSEIAVDSAGDVYYTNKTTLYTIPAGSTTASTFGSYTTPAGVSVDRFGNVFVTDSSTKYSFYEFPAVNGVANTSVQYTAFYGSSANGIAFDGHGHFFSTGAGKGL